MGAEGGWSRAAARGRDGGGRGCGTPRCRLCPEVTGDILRLVMHSQELDPGSLFQLKSWTRPFVCVPFKSRYSVILSSPPGAALSGSHPIQKLTSGTLPNQKILFYNLKISTISLCCPLRTQAIHSPPINWDLRASCREVEWLKTEHHPPAGPPDTTAASVHYHRK